MSESNKNKMDPISGEKVEVDGVYEDEWGSTRELKRGEAFPSDFMLGETEWSLTEYSMDSHPTGRTDPRLVPKEKGIEKQGN